MGTVPAKFILNFIFSKLSIGIPENRGNLGHVPVKIQIKSNDYFKTTSHSKK